MNGTDMSIIGLCILLSGCLTWICKRGLDIITNHLQNIQVAITALPCHRYGDQIARHEEQIKQLNERSRS